MANSTLNRRPRVLVENKIPFIAGVLEPVTDVEYVGGEEFTPERVRHVDALLVRTRNRCNAGLLAGSDVQFVATATIGLDHFDLPWLASAGIAAHNAPGCNAPAVAQYVLSSLAQVVNRPLRSYRLGIVGVGHVGRIVESWARSLGIDVMRCDPPRQRAEGGDDWYSLADLAAQADIITFHTPLTTTGADATYHLADEAFFRSLRRAPIIVNAARGPVVDNAALVKAIDEGRVGKVIIDTWEGEPGLSAELLRRAAVATPHIAGYSRQGKIRATQMVLDAFTEHFGLPMLKADAEEAPMPGAAVRLTDLIASYNPTADTEALKASPETFETQRDTYALRAEPVTRPED